MRWFRVKAELASDVIESSVWLDAAVGLDVVAPPGRRGRPRGDPRRAGGASRFETPELLLHALQVAHELLLRHRHTRAFFQESVQGLGLGVKG